MKRVFVLFCMLFFCIPSLLTIVHANDVPVLKTTGVMEIPEDFDFVVSETCPGHLFFQQAAAREDGWFVICSHYTPPADKGPGNFSRTYIDIYDEMGTFRQELSFATSQWCAADIQDDSVIIYFDFCIYIYSLETGELERFGTELYAAHDSGIATKLSRKKFTVGDWSYTCRDSFIGLVELTRTNGSEKQTLVKLPGTGLSNPKNIIAALSPGAVLLCVRWIRKRNRE